MSFFEGIYIPRPDVQRIQTQVHPEEVADNVLMEFKRKGRDVRNGNKVDQAVAFLKADRIAVPGVEVGNLFNGQFVWHLERWPVSGLRMTGMSPQLEDLLQASNKSFPKFAELLLGHPTLIDQDIGFKPIPERDILPSLGVRGKFRTHVIDGQHRITLVTWERKKYADCLVVYPRLRS